MEIIQKIRLGNSVPAIAAGALFYGDEQICGEEHIPVPPTPDYSTMYFTIESLEDGNTITFTKGNSAPENTFYYSTDGGSTWTSANSTTTWSVMNTGSKVMLKATASAWGKSAFGETYWKLSSTKTFNPYGNIMSMLYGDNFIGQTTINASFTFKYFFYGAQYLIDASNLILPATTLTESCYAGMFYGCTSLTTAPALNSPNVAWACYKEMFYNCQSLTTAPALPATTLANYCYSYMFSTCTSLTTAPELPATTLANECYGNMFRGCTSLNTAPELPATTLADNCYSYMFYNCKYLTTAPVLNATTLVAGCYNNMFYGCTYTDYIKCLATDISASNCVNNWLNYASYRGTFVKAASMTGWPSGASGIPSAWTIEDAA